MMGAISGSSDGVEGVGADAAKDRASPGDDLVRIVSLDPAVVATLVAVVESRGAAAQVIASRQGLDTFEHGPGHVICVWDLAACRTLGLAAGGVAPCFHPASDDLVLMTGDARHVRDTGLPLRTYHYRRTHLEALAAKLASTLEAHRGLEDPAETVRGRSAAIRRVREQIRRVAKFRDVSVLVLGETGVGKELVAQAIHRASHASGAPFVAINCAAIPEALFESELFGHESGAFTGARGTRVGLLESAASGTLFLDEIGDMPIALQPKLLRALETREFRRVGGTRTIPLAARVVSATHGGGPEGGAVGLREDLRYRLAGFTLRVPPLRERLEDVEPLARTFLSEFAARNGIEEPELEEGALARLLVHSFPGNVRELRRIVERCAILCESGSITATDVEDAFARAPTFGRETTFPVAEGGGARPPQSGIDVRPVQGAALPELERELMLTAYRESGQNLSLAARRLGIPRTTLRDRLSRFGALG